MKVGAHFAGHLQLVSFRANQIIFLGLSPSLFAVNAKFVYDLASTFKILMDERSGDAINQGAHFV